MTSLPPSDTRHARPFAALHPALAKPPTALSLTVRKLLNRIQDGEVRVPKFQRPLRWQAGDVTKLFDSLLRGYPIGSLLFWKQPVPQESILIGAARLDAKEHADGWYIVDGQQRTTALAAALLELDQTDPRWVVRFDPAANEFLSGPAPEGETKRHVPLAALGDIRRLGKWLRECALSEAEQSHVEDVQQRILDYEIPAYVVENDDADALRGVFARLNSTGVRLRADEVFQALLGAPVGADGVGRADLDELQRACDIDGFGSPPRGEVLKALLAMSDFDPTKRLQEIGEDAAARLASTDEAREALQRTIAFLQADLDAAEPGAGIPAYAFIPYPIVFVILSKWFHRFPDPSTSARKELARWVFRGAVTGVHQRAAVSAMRDQIRKIGGTEVDSLRALIEAVDAPAPVDWKLATFHATRASSRIELLTLLARGPRDRDGAVSWRTLVTSGENAARHVFRSAPRAKLDPDARDLIRTVANRVLLDARHTDLGRELARWSWVDDRGALESHFIDEEAFALLRERNPSGFLRHRASRLRTEVMAFVARRAGLGEPRLLAVETYYEDVEPPPSEDT